jgi:hypothetical protein
MNNSDKVILDLCGGTGAWSKYYKQNGYTVVLVSPDRGTGDVRLSQYLSDMRPYGILAAPPCTMFSRARNSYISIEKRKGTYDEKLINALSIVDACLRVILITKPCFWALENPVGYLGRFLGRPRMYFQPYEFGDMHTKYTCLWGDFNFPMSARRGYFDRCMSVEGEGGHFGVDPSQIITGPGARAADMACQKGQVNVPGACNRLDSAPKKTYMEGAGKPADVDISVWRAITPDGFARAFFEANQ